MAEIEARFRVSGGGPVILKPSGFLLRDLN